MTYPTTYSATGNCTANPSGWPICGTSSGTQYQFKAALALAMQKTVTAATMVPVWPNNTQSPYAVSATSNGYYPAAPSPCQASSDAAGSDTYQVKPTELMSYTWTQPLFWSKFGFSTTTMTPAPTDGTETMAVGGTVTTLTFGLFPGNAWAGDMVNAYDQSTGTPIDIVGAFPPPTTAAINDSGMLVPFGTLRLCSGTTLLQTYHYRETWEMRAPPTSDFSGLTALALACIKRRMIDYGTDYSNFVQNLMNVDFCVPVYHDYEYATTYQYPDWSWYGVVLNATTN